MAAPRLPLALGELPPLASGLPICPLLLSCLSYTDQGIALFDRESLQNIDIDIDIDKDILENIDIVIDIDKGVKYR